MTSEILIKRYADAFLAYSKESIGTEKAIDSLQGVKRIIKNNPDFKSFLGSPEITDSEKDEVIDKVFAEDFPEETRYLLKYLVKKGRINLLIEIAEYARITYSHGVAIEAILKTSYPIDTDIMRRLRSALEKKFDRQIHFYLELDASLMGGIYIRIGNIIIDGSARKRLEDIKEKLMMLKVA